MLVYPISEPDPAWDGTHVTSVDPHSPDEHPLAIVEFKSCEHRLGGPGDESLGDHRLWGRGLTYYSAHLVHNSVWLNEVAPLAKDRPARECWERKNHYVITFHDSTFECITDGYEITQRRQSFHAALHALVDRL